MKIVKLGAEWCAPCKMLERTLELIKADEKYKDIEIVSYDVEKDDEGQELAIQNKVSSIPVTLFYDDNDELVFKFIGNAPKRDIEQTIQLKFFGGKKETKEEDKKEETA